MNLDTRQLNPRKRGRDAEYDEKSYRDSERQSNLPP
jgi:hypothetical protein